MRMSNTHECWVKNATDQELKELAELELAVTLKMAELERLSDSRKLQQELDASEKKSELRVKNVDRLRNKPKEADDLEFMNL